MSEHRALEGGVLVVGPSWVGDMVMAQSLFKVLAAAQPGRAIDVLAPAWSLPILARMPQVREGIAMPLGHGEFGWGARRRLGKSLAARGYAQAIVLPGSWKSALVPFFAGIARRTGYRGEMRYGLLNDLRKLDPAALPLTVQRFVALGLPASADLPEPLPLPSLVSDLQQQQAIRAKLGLTDSRPVLALLPGAEYGPAKQWPLTHYAELARELEAMGYAVWILGSAKDAPAGEEIVAGAAQAINLCGRTTLEEAVDLLAGCVAAVSNDSGLMHVAAALEVPVVALYGSSSAAHTPPLSERAQVLSLGLTCAPCFRRECPLPDPAAQLRCLRDISPAQVLALLHKEPAGGLRLSAGSAGGWSN